jgi:hypothetical protein
VAASKAQKAWDGLNERQRLYLETVFHEDTKREEEHRWQSARYWSSTPARVWRRIPLNSAGSSLAASLRAKKIYDTGAGSTLAALTTRGLVEVDYVEGVLTTIVCVRLTTAGRAAARAGLGYGPRWVKPKWALSEWLWREFVKVVRAGETGLPTDDLWGSAHSYLVEGEPVRGNRPLLTVVKTYPKPRPRRPGEPLPFTSQERRWYVLTEEGRAHYDERLAEYREIYPEVDTTGLPESVTLSA